MKVAFHTLGCKVNSYESQAMLNMFEEAGYQEVDFKEEADVYVINTCTVTNTGDSKSRQSGKWMPPQNKIHTGVCHDRYKDPTA